MQRPLSTLPLGMTIRNKLKGAGFEVVGDLKGLGPLRLANEVGISKEDAVQVLESVFPSSVDENVVSDEGSRKMMSLQDMAKEEKELQPIVTFSSKIDDLLGGGVPLTKLTEICGAPGIGKTQLCFQLCVDVQIPKRYGGTEGEALYVDTEGSCTVERVMEMASAAVNHCRRFSKDDDDSDDFNVDSVLSKIHFYRCYDYTELIATVTLLPDILMQHPKIKLVVIDSIVFPFRIKFEEKLYTRTRILNELAQSLVKLATTHKLAVVLSNQMTTKVECTNTSYLIPALGETWGHACTLRLILFWRQNQRFITLVKCPWRQETTVPFQITSAGIRDIVEDKSPCIKEQNKRQTESVNKPLNKRMKL